MLNIHVFFRWLQWYCTFCCKTACCPCYFTVPQNRPESLALSLTVDRERAEPGGPQLQHQAGQRHSVGGEERDAHYWRELPTPTSRSSASLVPSCVVLLLTRATVFLILLRLLNLIMFAKMSFTSLVSRCTKEMGTSIFRYYNSMFTSGLLCCMCGCVWWCWWAEGATEDQRGTVPSLYQLETASRQVRTYVSVTLTVPY